MVPASGGGSEWFPRSEEEQMVPANGGRRGLGLKTNDSRGILRCFPFAIPSQSRPAIGKTSHRRFRL